MEADHLMRGKGIAAEEARRQALAAFGGVDKHKEELRDGRGLAWLGSLSLDVKLAVRMLLKYPGLTLAGGLAIAIAIGIGAGWYDLIGKIMSPRIPLPQGERIVEIQTQDARTNEPEARVLHDFQEWQHELRTVEDLGAYRTDTRNLIVGQHGSATHPDCGDDRRRVRDGAGATPARTRAGALRRTVGSARRGGARLRRLAALTPGSRDVLGLVVRLGSTPATVIGVMPEGLRLPVQPRCLDTAVAARLVRGARGGPDQCHREARIRNLARAGECGVACVRPAHGRGIPGHSRASPAGRDALGEATDFLDVAALAARNLPVLLVLSIACMSVGTLVYARTATREGEFAIRAALGAGRARIIGQLFVEALVLASVSAAIGLLAVDRALAWGIESVNRDSGGAPFWMVPGLELSTVLYAGGLAIVSAVMLSVLPALRVTSTRVQPHLANLGTGRATLRFGRVWTGAMIAQVALTAMGIPAAMESASETMRKVRIRAQFPSRQYLAARIDLDRPFEEDATAGLQQRRAETFAALARRIEQEPGVVAVAFADRVPGEAGLADSRRSRRPPAGRRYTTATFARRGVATVLRHVRQADHRGPSIPRGRLECPRPERSSSTKRSRAQFARDAGPGSPVGGSPAVFGVVGRG